jgi:hypothetical protein
LFYRFMSHETLSESYVVKINTALSNKPFFVKIHDPNMSLDSIFQEAITTLKETKPLESQQLESLYKSHQIFNEGKLIQKGNLFNELGKHDQAVGNMTAHIAELDLVSSHSGGIHNSNNPSENPLKGMFDAFKGVTDNLNEMAILTLTQTYQKVYTQLVKDMTGDITPDAIAMIATDLTRILYRL